MHVIQNQWLGENVIQFRVKPENDSLDEILHDLSSDG